MSAWLKRFGLHLAAAVGATGIFVAAAAVGASQSRQQVVMVSSPAATVRTRPAVPRKPSVVVVATPTPAPQSAGEATGQATPAQTVSSQTPDSSPSTPGPSTAQSGTPRATGQSQTAGGPGSATGGAVGAQPGAVGAQPGAGEAQPGPGEAQPGPGEAQQPGAVDGQPEPDQPLPGAQQPPQGAARSGDPSSASPRPTPRAAATARVPTPAAQKVAPERSLAGTIKAVFPDGLDVVGVGGREWRVTPAPGALIRLNGKTARLDSLQAGDTVVILGQAQSGPGNPFMAHAITARRK